ncbi:MAG: hypothetical protein GIW99_07030 [Candidatus Eremiobacteraeota bacterium]|nr:hypothetical protein [Candidatus Eremiobacteraeota bacterium]MBC5827417.1 hypothetical protein [Candidatus Eremiobacteraeota bacterium]
MSSRLFLLAPLAVALVAVGCAKTSTTVETGPVNAGAQAALLSATPPPAVSTPVPVVRSHPVPGSGRKDPFIALFGPPTAPAQSAQGGKPPGMVAVSTFPNIPTLPGFEPIPGSAAGTGANRPPPLHTIWDGVRLSGVVQDNGFTAIVEADGRSFIVRTGDMLANTFRVVAIGHNSVTLATGSAERHFTLGG